MTLYIDFTVIMLFTCSRTVVFDLLNPGPILNETFNPPCHFFGACRPENEQKKRLPISQVMRTEKLFRL